MVVFSSLRHIDSLPIRVYKNKDDHPSGGPILGGRKISSVLRERRSKLMWEIPVRSMF